MKILILGAAGQIGRLVTKRLIEETDHSLVLYASRRISVKPSLRVSITDGDFNNQEALHTALSMDIDIDYLNDMNSPEATKNILQAMKAKKVTKIISASILGNYDEVPGGFGQWNERMVGKEGINRHK